jgi:hypothetical protein
MSKKQKNKNKNKKQKQKNKNKKHNIIKQSTIKQNVSQ